MSRIGKLPIDVPAGVKVRLEGVNIFAEGPKGKLKQLVPGIGKGIQVEVNGNQVLVKRDSEAQNVVALHGLSRTLINNVVEGVSKGYEKMLEIQGVGYKAVMKGKAVEIQAGYSHSVTVQPMENTVISVEGTTKIKVVGPDKYAVGQVAATIRKVKKPEPYKGKGVRYLGEQVRKKAGKTNAA